MTGTRVEEALVRRITRRCVVLMVRRVATVRRTARDGVVEAVAGVRLRLACEAAGPAIPAFGIATWGRVATGTVNAGSDTGAAVDDS
jgi:hypothetical protein